MLKNLLTHRYTRDDVAGNVLWFVAFINVERSFCTTDYAATLAIIAGMWALGRWLWDATDYKPLLEC